MDRGIEVEKDGRVIVGQIGRRDPEIMIAASPGIVDQNIDGASGDAVDQRVDTSGT